MVVRARGIRVLRTSRVLPRLGVRPVVYSWEVPFTPHTGPSGKIQISILGWKLTGSSTLTLGEYTPTVNTAGNVVLHLATAMPMDTVWV